MLELTRTYGTELHAMLFTEQDDVETQTNWTYDADKAQWNMMHAWQTPVDKADTSRVVGQLVRDGWKTTNMLMGD